jgi:hypothetical protein
MSKARYDVSQHGREGGIRSGESRRAKSNPINRAVANVLSSRSGAANIALVKELGGLERQQAPQPAAREMPHVEPPDVLDVLAAMPPDIIAGALERIGKEKLAAAFDHLSREEEMRDGQVD